VIVGPAGEAANSVRLARAAREHDHRRLRVDARGEAVGRANPIQHVEAAAVREKEVEHDERGLAHLDRPEALARPARARDTEAVSGEIVE
jgi:hypothetical protein